MDNLSNINQIHIQQALSPSNVQPTQNNPAPNVNQEPQVNLTQEPDAFVSSKKSHKKAIIGIGAFIAAAGGLFALVKTGKLSFTGKEQGINNPIPIPDEIVKIKDDVLDSVSAIQEKAKSIITQSKDLQTKSENIQTSAKKEFDEVLEIIKKGALNNFEETGNVRFIDETNKNGQLIRKAMEEFEGDKILRRATFHLDNIENIHSIDKGFEKMPDGKKAAESFKFYNGKLYEYGINVEETETYSKAAEEFSFDTKRNNLETWSKDYFYSDSEFNYGEYIQYFDDTSFLWEKDFKGTKKLISGVETKIETTAEKMSLQYDENNFVKSYEKGVEDIREYCEGKTQTTYKTDEEYVFDNNLLSQWIKGFEMDINNEQKTAYILFFNDDGTPYSCTVNSTGMAQQDAYYRF